MDHTDRCSEALKPPKPRFGIAMCIYVNNNLARAWIAHELEEIVLGETNWGKLGQFASESVLLDIISFTPFVERG